MLWSIFNFLELRRRSYAKQAILRHYPLANQRFLRSVDVNPIDHNIDVQSVFSWVPWAPKVARKCESKDWYTCGADGRAAGGVRSRDYQIFWDG